MTSLSEKEKALIETVALDRKASLPLYAQVRRGLERLIQETFEDGERFFTEQVLSERLGVSLATVRKALADLVAEGALDRRPGRGSFVRKAEPAPGGVSRVGIILPSCEWGFEGTATDRLVEHLRAVCADRGYRISLFRLAKGTKGAEVLRVVDGVPERTGFILLCNIQEDTYEWYHALAAQGFRTVNVDTLIENYPGAYVGVSNVAGIRLGMAHLLDLGHRRITLLVNEPLGHAAVQHRVQAFEVMARENKLTHAHVVVRARRVVYDEGDPDGRLYHENIDEAKIDEILGFSPRPTAILTVSDPGAWVVLRRLALRGIRVPQQISVLGFGDEGPSQVVHPALSTIALPYAAMAERAVAILQHPGSFDALQFLPPTLVLRESTQPAPSV